MRTIQITIAVPDDVEVSVSQEVSEGKPFVSRPTPPEPNFPCPEHGTGWRLIKAGVSKSSGKPYNAFWVCQTENCQIKPWQVERETVIEDVSSLSDLPF